ncbi:MAG: GAF domain-containing protein [Chloroflexota bacterium]|nr:GAF domain-containing protein [Chloroflexota bacterium]
MPNSDEATLNGSKLIDNRLASVDWPSSGLGLLESWPASLRATLESCLTSNAPAVLWWGDQFIQFGNDAYDTVFSDDPTSSGFGGRAEDVSPLLWSIVGPTIERVRHDGQIAIDVDVPIHLNIHRSAETQIASFVHVPVFGADGRIGGVFTIVLRSEPPLGTQRQTTASDRTGNSENRAALLQSVTAKLAGAATTNEVGQVVVGEGLAAFRADSGVVALCSPTDSTVDVVASTGYSVERIQQWESFPLQSNSPMADGILRGKTTILRSRAEALIAYPNLGAEFANAGTEAWVAAPLAVRGQILGALVFSFAWPQQFSDNDLEDIQALASQCAQSIERAQLFDAERAARDHAEGIADRVARLQAVTAAMAEAASREEVAEAALRESIAAVGATAGGLGVLDASRRSIQRLAMLGYPPEIVEGTRNVPIDELGPIGDTARTGEAIWLETNEQLFARYPRLGAIPARRTYGAAISVPLSAGGEVIGVLSLRFREERPFSAEDRDLIYAIARGCAQALERSRLYEAERAARAEAEDAVRARDEFLSIASHELRTPIAALKGATQLILRRRARGDRDEERLTRTLTILNETADRLTGLTDDLLDVSRLRTGHLTLTIEPIDLSALVASVVERSRDDFEGHHEIVLDAFPGSLPIPIDPSRIDQVISNLLDNAVKYSPAGGRIRITVGTDGNGIRVSVHDEGIGLPDESTESIFEPFGRATNAAISNLPGMGLGLYICRNIINLHGGWIRAESPGEGQGTTNMFWLPESMPEDYA